MNSEKGKEILDSLLEGIQIIDFNWRYIYVNPALVKYSQYTKEEMIGFTIMEKYPGVENTELFKVLGRCMHTRMVQHLENEFVFPDGRVGFFELNIQPIPEGIFIMSIDITERRKAQAEQKRTETYYRSVVEESLDTIYIVDPTEELKILEMNKAGCDLLGYTREEILQLTALDVIFEADIATIKQKINTIRGGEATRNDRQLRKKDGTAVEVDVTAKKMDDGNMLVVARDNSVKKQAEKEMLALNESLEIRVKERTQELESFSYSVSHDLRAPLRAVNGYSEMLAEDYDSILDAEGKRLLTSIRSNAIRMGKLIDDLLAFSKVGRAAMKKSEFDLRELVQGVISEVNKSTEHKAEIRIGTLHKVKADYSLLSQVIFNLISNALKYSSKKERPVVEIFSEEKGGDLIFSVRDNGVGFDMAYYDKLFGVFQRLHSQEEFEGTGVGLAIVQRIVFKHGGKVWAEGKLNEGATFSIQLPNQ